MSDDTDLYFRQIAAGDMQNFIYLVGSRSTRECVIVDPAWRIPELIDVAKGDEMQIVGVLATHYHQDHIGGSLFGHTIPGLNEFLELNPAPVHVNKHEAPGTAQVSGIPESELETHDAGDTIELGGVTIRLLHTPGHTPGSQCFLVEQADQAPYLVSGDTLFLGSCGRVDLPGSNPEDMYYSLNHTLKKLPDETLVFPGHGYSEDHGTLGDQKKTNPMLRVSDLETFLGFMGVPA